jgi:serine/threonine-protein kinase HipA
LTLLNVWIEGVDFPIGQLARLPDTTTAFAYTNNWLSQPDSFPISLSLPLDVALHGDAASRAFFNNLLHENDQLDQVLRLHGLERNDVVGILAYLGADCPGAISCLLPDAPPVKRPGNLYADYDPIASDVLEEAVQRMVEGRPLPDELRDPSPVAGFRRKISLALLPDGRFGIPKSGLGVPTTHILKIPDRNHRGEAEQEAFATHLARSCGFSASKTIATQIAEQDVVLIERFDRLVDTDGNITRLHQEDFAQALGLPSDVKYERRAVGAFRFDLAAIATVLDRTAVPALAREEFLRATLFNLLIGNTDNHAKNHALLYVGGQAVLAPLYDMVPIPLGNGYTDEFAFNIGNARRATELSRQDLESLAVTIGYPKSRAGQVVRKAVSEIILHLEKATAELAPSLRRFDMLFAREANRLDDLLNLGLALRERDYLPEGKAGGWVIS